MNEGREHPGKMYFPLAAAECGKGRARICGTAAAPHLLTGNVWEQHERGELTWHVE